MAVRDEIRAYLDQDETEDFSRWAFGKDHKTIPSSEQFMRNWNERHGHLLNLEGNQSYSSTLPKMILLWKGKEVKE